MAVKDAVALFRLPRHERGQNSSASKGRRPESRGSRKAAPETPRARRKRPSLKAAAAAAAAPPGPQRPPASRPTGLTSAPAAQLTAPLRRAALTRPHARRGRGAAGMRAARFRPPLPLPRASWAGPSRPAARARALARSGSSSAGSRVPAAGPRLHLAHRALFLCPTGKPKQSEPRRRGKETESRKGGGGAR